MQLPGHTIPKDFPLGVKIAKSSAMLGIGQDFVAHHAKARLTSLCLQHVQVYLFLGVVQSLANTFAAGFVALHAPTAICLAIEAHETISTPFHFEEPRFAFIMGGVLWGVIVGKPLVLGGGKLFLLFGLDQHEVHHPKEDKLYAEEKKSTNEGY